jgi:hypothetical protein
MAFLYPKLAQAKWSQRKPKKTSQVKLPSMDGHRAR